MKPSDIETGGLLVGTLGKAEAEWQACNLLKVLSANGDTWRAVSPAEYNKHFFPWYRLRKRLFHIPYFEDLLAFGFAGTEGWETDWFGRFEVKFTDRAIQRFILSEWNMDKETQVQMTPQERFYRLIGI